VTGSFGNDERGRMMERTGTAGFRHDLYGAMAKVVLLAAGVIVLLWFLFTIQRVLLVFALALILALAINAPVTALERRGMARGYGLLTVILTIAAVAGGLGWLVVPRLLNEIPTLVEEVPAMIERLGAQIVTLFGDSPEIDRQVRRLIDWITDAARGVWQHVGAIAGVFVLALFVFAMVLYMVANPRPLLRGYLRAMPPHLREPAARAFARGSSMVVGWVASNVILGGMKAITSFIFLSILGIPGAIVWSVLALFSALIERLGFYLMAIPPVVVAFAVDPVNAVWVLLFYWALSEFLGNFVAPKIRAETMHLNAVYILFMTLAMAYAFGLLGVLIASPVAGFLMAYFDEFYLRRQPVDPHEERRLEKMLARDPER
jgi:putative permease